MSMQGFRGNCDSQGKLGMCPSLAESDSGGIPRRELLLEKTVFPVRQKGVPPLLLPASVLQLPRCLARTYNLDFHDLTLLELDSFQKCNCSRKNRLQNSICFANVGYSPTPRQHFCKTAAPKNFSAACGSYLSTKTKKQADMLLHILPASFLFKNWLIRLPSSFSSELLSVFPHHAASATKPTGSVQSRWNDKYQPEYQLPSEWQSAESNPIP